MRTRWYFVHLVLAPLLLVLALWPVADAHAAGVVVTVNTSSVVLTVNGTVSGFIPITGSGGTGALTYSILPSLPAGLSFNTTNGEISGTPTAALTTTFFTVEARDTANAAAGTSFQLTVNPAVVATQTLSSVTVTANRAILTFTPVTGSGGAGSLTYSVSPVLPTGLSLSPTRGAISGTPTAAKAATTYTITVTDANGAKASAPFSLTVNSAVAATQSIASVVATANHSLVTFTPVTGSGGTTPLGYSISPALPTGLSLSPTSGAISGTPTARLSSTTYTVTVTDITGATASATFQLTVNSAVVATQAIATKALTVNTAAMAFTPVTGSGGTGSLSYGVSPGLPAGLSIESTSGQITGTPSATQGTTTYTVTVTDTVGSTATATFSLSVNGAVMANAALGVVRLTVNIAAVAVIPVTGSGGVGPLSYSISPALPAGLTFDATSGTLSGTPTVTHSSSTHTVTVTDANNATASARFNVVVAPTLVAIQSVPSIVLTANHTFTPVTPVTAQGGTQPLFFSVPRLVAGMTFSPPTGQISGTPTATLPPTTITLTVNDANGATASATFELTVNSRVVATQAVPSTALTVNTAAAPFTPVTGSGGTGTLTYSVAPGLPAGLTFDMSNGQITGTATATQTAATYTVTVKDTNNATDTATFSLAVNSAIVATQAVPSTALTVNAAAAPFTPVTGSGGTSPLSYSVSPSLPAGLAFNTASGEITGTPTATVGSTSFTVTVKDAVGSTATNTFSLTVNSAVVATQVIASTVLTVGASAPPFIPVTGSGGTGALTYGVSPSLPSNLTFNATNGQITGTPGSSEMGTTHTVTVTDANGATASATFSLTVNSAVTATAAVPSKTLTVSTLATPFIPVVGGGGTGALSYAVSPSLPSGLSFDAMNGRITGTPTAIQTAVAYTVTATDTNNATASANFSLAIDTIATATTLTASANTGLIGQPIALKAAVFPSASIGTVTFNDGATVLCANVAVLSGSANCSTSFSSGGVHNLIAVYTGGGSYAGSTSAALQVSITDQTAKTVQTIGGFMRRRNDLIASNEPDTNRQIDRLNQARGASGATTGSGFAASSSFGASSPSRLRGSAETSRVARYLGGDPGRSLGGTDAGPQTGDREETDASGVPMRISAGSDGPLQFGFAASLSDIMRSNAEKDRAKVANALGYGSGLPKSADAAPSMPFDIWVEGKYSSFRDHEVSTGLDGHFGLFTLGADYVLNPSLLVGVYIQFDNMSERDDEKLTDIEGHGWMAGPYATMRLTDEFYWQVRAGWGGSSNDVSPFQTYVDSFDTSRWLLSSTLTGRWTYGAWQLSPSASLTYIDETSESYADTYGVLIPVVKNRLGQAKIGPEVAYRFQSISGATLEPHAKMELIWNFADELSANGFGDIDDTAGPAGVRGRVELGLRAMNWAGIGFDVTGSYDGIGSGAYSAITGQGELSIPFN